MRWRSCPRTISSIYAAPIRPLPDAGVTTVCGPGTGLGVAQVFKARDGYHVLPTEGGHIDYAPLDSIEDAIVKRLRKTFTRVSTERVVSGPAIVAIYETLADLEGRAVPSRDDRTIWTEALDGSDSIALAALDRFCLALGAVAGDLALAQGAKAVVIAGGLGLRIKDRLLRSGFDQRFVAKGRFQSLMAGDPGQAHHPSPTRPLRRCRRLCSGTSLMTASPTDIATIMQTSAVIPVLVIDDAATARPLAEALVAGGLRVLEVTMRTGAALEAMAEMKKVPGAIVGAGTVVTADQFRQVMDADAEFIVSPGLSQKSGAADRRQRRPLPARCRDRGRHHARARHGADALQILPRRNQRWPARAQGTRRAVLPVQLLPHRRYHRSERAGLAGVQTRALRRRQLGHRRHDGRGRGEGGARGRLARLTGTAASFCIDATTTAGPCASAGFRLPLPRR